MAYRANCSSAARGLAYLKGASLIEGTAGGNIQLTNLTLPRRANHFDLSETVSSPSDKNISVFQNGKSVYINSHPVPFRGIARSPMRDGDAVDVDGAPDQDA
jgi:hypothetical protein